MKSVRQAAGKEPVWDSKKGCKQVDVVLALNWYNRECTEKDAAKYLGVPPIIARDFCTLAWVTRMKKNGFKFQGKSIETIDEMQNRFNATKEARKAEASGENVVSIQERVQAKSENIIGEMEGLLDEYGVRGDAKKLNVYQWMVDNEIKPIHANRIIEHFRNRSKEVFAAIEGKDAELKEGYAKLGKKRLLNLLQAYVAIIKDAERLAQQTKTARKPRKKKPVSFEKKVSKIKFMVRDDKLKLQSIDPVRIIGSQQLWTYNTKTRKLGVYNAFDGSGLSMKGTTIKNYGEDTSISKTLRKPEKVLPIVVDGGKIALRKVLDDVNSKPIKLNGRINKYTLLLRVI